MFLIFFASFIVSQKGTYHIKLSKQHKFLSSFGFRSNSNFSYEIYSKYPIKLYLFLLSSEEFYQPSFRYLYKACNNSSLQIAKLNQTYYTEKSYFTWNGNISKQDIYYPLILICSKNYSKLEIRYKYSNNLSFIDFRNDNNSIIYLSFSVINLFLGIIWLINTYTKTDFSIPLQQFISLVPLLKAISNSLIAFDWEKLKIKDELTKYETAISMLFSSLFYFIFMYTATLAFSGWCIFREIECIEKVELFLSVLFLVIGFDFQNFYGTIFKVIGAFWYIKISLNYLSISLLISESNFFDKKMKLKVRLVQNFSLSFVVVVIFTGLVEYCANYVGAADIVCDSIAEIGIVNLEAVEIFFFFLRDEFDGFEDPSYRDERLPLLLIEPQKKQYIFMNKDDQQ